MSNQCMMGQSSEEERNLLLQLNAAKTDSARFFIYRDLGFIYELTDTNKAFSYYRIEEQIGERNRNDLWKSMAKSDFGNTFFYAGDFDKALFYFNQSLSISTKAGLKERSQVALQNIANTHYSAYRTDSAVYFALQATELQLQLADTARLVATYSNLAAYLDDLHLYDEALRYVELGKKFSRESQNANGELFANIMGATISQKQRKKDLFEDYLLFAIALAPSAESDYLRASAYQNISGLYYDENEYQRALIFADSALHYLQGMEETNIADAIWFSKALALQKNGMPDKAEAYFSLALKSALNREDWQVVREVHLHLAEIAEERNDFGNALIQFKLFEQYKDSTLQESMVRNTAEINTKFRTEKQQLMLDKLTADNQLVTLMNQQQKRRWWISLGAFVLLAIILVLMWIVQRRKAQLATQALAFEQEQTKRLESEKQVTALDSMLKGEENERSRVAKDLHDGIGSLLSGVKLSLASMKGNMLIHQDQAQIFESSLTQLDQAIGEMRRVAQNMMPEVLINSGLLKAMEFFLHNMNQSSGMAIHLEHHQFEDRLPSDYEIVVYRILQELINNAAKHAHASEVMVQMNRVGDHVNFVVEDNGRGFDQELWLKSSGMGFANIRSRVNYLKGNISLKTSPNEGSSFLVEFQLPSMHE